MDDDRAGSAEEPTLTTAQVADLLGISRPSVSRIPWSRLPFVRKGPGELGHRRYRVSDVEAYQAGRVAPAPPADRLESLEERMARVERHLGLGQDEEG